MDTTIMFFICVSGRLTPLVYSLIDRKLISQYHVGWNTAPKSQTLGQILPTGQGIPLWIDGTYRPCVLELHAERILADRA